MLDGIGGLYYAGRWHNSGFRVIYTAQYRSLAALEYLVHLSSSNLLLANYVVATIFIPDNVSKEIIQPNTVKDLNQTSVTRKLGGDFLKAGKSLILQVPSAIVPEETNFIINPVHSQMNLCKIVELEAFRFDGRLAK